MIGVGDTGTVWMVQREVKLHSNATKPTYLAFVVPREYSISSPQSRLPLTVGCRSASQPRKSPSQKHVLALPDLVTWV